MSPAEIRERYERIREEVGSGVTVVAATKYVSVEDLAALAKAGVETVARSASITSTEVGSTPTERTQSAG